MPNDRAFVQALALGACIRMHARGSIEPSSCVVHLHVHQLQLVLHERKRFRFLDDKREASITKAMRNPFRKNCGEKNDRKLFPGENDFLEIAKGFPKRASSRRKVGRFTSWAGFEWKESEGMSGSERRDKELIFGFTARRSVHEIYRAWSFRLT